jgi:hypothetical protein
MKTALSLALTYFALVFGAGFVLGSLRVLLLVPAMGERYAELAETPLMLLVIYFSARYVVRKGSAAAGRRGFLLVGALALLLLLVLEFTVVLALRGLTVAEYVASRDPVSGGVYLASLTVYLLAPWLLAGRDRGRRE